MTETSTNLFKDRIASLEAENEMLKQVIRSDNKKSNLLNTQQQLEESILAYEKRENEITELLTVTHSILKTSDFKTTAKLIFDSCARTIGAKAGYVALLSEDGSENELLFLEDGGLPCTVDLDLPMPVRGLREVSYRTGKVVYDNDFMDSEWVKYMPEGHLALPNVLFSPLNIEGKTVGIIGMACKETDFNDNDAKIAAAFGEYAAIALQNSRTMEELRNSNMEKDKFFSIISHDLKSPVTTLFNLSECLINDICSKKINNLHDHVEDIHHCVCQTLNLVNQLLEWSRLQQGRFEFYPEHVNPENLINRNIDLFEQFSKQKNLSIRKEIEKDLMVYADVNMLDSVIRNLVNNALKYSYPGGSIVIKSIKEDGAAKISVADTGVGIEDKDMEKLFKIENSFSTCGTNKEPGTGLGLILCREFVNKHGGHIGVESEIGKGSYFWFTIPDK